MSTAQLLIDAYASMECSKTTPLEEHAYHSALISIACSLLAIAQILRSLERPCSDKDSSLRVELVK